jgi:hypothetical protein
MSHNPRGEQNLYDLLCDDRSVDRLHQGRGRARKGVAKRQV